MKISKELEWLKPYLDVAETIVPKIKRLIKLQVLKAQPGKICRVHGKVVKCIDDQTFEISLYDHYNSIVKIKPELVLKKKKYSKIDMLMALAHEIAHIVYWDHCTARQILESQLTILFMSKLNSGGYISEEAEFRRRKKR